MTKKTPLHHAEAERVTNEQQRVVEEQQRQRAEGTRVTNENQRQSAENARVAAIGDVRETARELSTTLAQMEKVERMRRSLRDTPPKNGKTNGKKKD